MCTAPIPSIHAKLIFCSNTPIEMRKISVQSLNFQQLIQVVLESIQHATMLESIQVQLQYLAADNTWITFQTNDEWIIVKQSVFQNGTSLMKIRVLLQSDCDIKPCCTRQESNQTICFESFYEFRKRLEQYVGDCGSVLDQKVKRRRSVPSLRQKHRSTRDKVIGEDWMSTEMFLQ
jgi:hypothetical protein